jgi:hypothetical protein
MEKIINSDEDKNIRNNTVKIYEDRRNRIYW